MKSRIWFQAVLVVALPLVGCSMMRKPAQNTADADIKAINQIEANWSQYMGTRSVDKFSTYYADNACLCRTGMPIVNKKANIVTLYRKLMLDPNFNFKFATGKVVLSRSGDMAYTQGTYDMNLTNQQTKKVVAEKGKYLLVYMKQPDKTWKVVADIANADGPQLPVEAKKSQKRP